MKKHTINKPELYDLDRQILSGQFRAATSRENWVSINAADFIGWLYETNRIGNYHAHGEGLVELHPGAGYFDPTRAAYIETAAGTIHYTFQEFISDCADDALILQYLACLPEPASEFEQAVMEAQAQAAPARETETFTPEQEAQMWAEYYED